MNPTQAVPRMNAVFLTEMTGPGPLQMDSRWTPRAQWRRTKLLPTLVDNAVLTPSGAEANNNINKRPSILDHFNHTLHGITVYSRVLTVTTGTHVKALEQMCDGGV
jgi:hypothetical protein